jgi:hypothetical protein
LATPRDDIRQLQRLDRRLRRRISRNGARANQYWRIYDAVRPQYRYSQAMVSLAGFEQAVLMWVNLTRLKLIQAKIRRLTGEP